MRSVVVLLIFGLGGMAVSAAEPAPEQFGRKVDQPIPETYEPLTGPAWSDTFSSEIQAHRQLRKQKPAGPQPANTAPGKYPISEPQPESSTDKKPPAIEETGGELRIREP